MTTDRGLVPIELIQNKIMVIRDEKVMVDRDLAELYGVETKQLKRVVRRNAERFPPDFMFELTREEYNSLRSQFGTLIHGVRNAVSRTTIVTRSYYDNCCSYRINCQ